MRSLPIKALKMLLPDMAWQFAHLELLNAGSCEPLQLTAISKVLAYEGLCWQMPSGCQNRDPLGQSSSIEMQYPLQVRGRDE